MIPFLLAIVILFYTPQSKNHASSAYNIKKENYNVNNYLEKNHSEINTEAFTGFNLLDEDINKNDVILAGEYSGVGKNYLVKLSMVKYLNEKYNIRYLLEDIGYSQACIINQYLNSGDESLLRSLYFGTTEYGGSTLGTDFDYKESYDFWVKLRKYNLSIPESKRILVIGVGFESQLGLALKYINSLLPQSEPAAEINPCIKNFRNICNEKNKLQKNFNKIINSKLQREKKLDEISKASEKLQKNYEETLKSIKKLQKNMETYQSIYEKYLGGNYFDFHIVVDNINNSGIISNVSDSNIYSNFKRIYSNLPREKYFGEFNMGQVYQKTPRNMNDYTRFAAYLNSSDSPVKDKVLSIAYAYENSKVMTYKNADNTEAAEPFDVGILKNVSKSDITLFKLNGENSPFSTKSYFITGKNDMYTTDYFKYILLIKNSKAANPNWKVFEEYQY